VLIVVESTFDTGEIALAPGHGSFENVTELLRVEWHFARDHDALLMVGKSALPEARENVILPPSSGPQR